MCVCWQVLPPQRHARGEAEEGRRGLGGVPHAGGQAEEGRGRIIPHGGG